MGRLSLHYNQDSRIGRDRISRLVEQAQLIRRDPPGSARKIVGEVYNGGAMPTTVPAWFFTHPVDFGCLEIEGGGCSPTVDFANTVPILALGPRVPGVGDLLPARMIGGKWVTGSGGGKPTTNNIIKMTGCANQPVPGLLVKVWTNSSETTLVFSGTTDSLGQVAGIIPSNGTYWVDAQTGNTGEPWLRWASLPKGNQSLQIGLTKIIALGAIASGYACGNSTCWFGPFKTTLNFTDSVYGSYQLVHGADSSRPNNWAVNPETGGLGGHSIVYPGCTQFGVTCPSHTYTGSGTFPAGFAYYWDCVLFVDWEASTGALSPAGCPAGTEVVAECQYFLTTATFPGPGSSLLWTCTTGPAACTGAGHPYVYCSAPTFTVTE